MRLRYYLLTALLVSGAHVVSAADWSQWRGPNRDGICAEENLLQQWPQGGPKLLWKATGLGDGYSAPAIVGKTIYKGAGCKRCGGTGYRGRLGVFEMLQMNTTLRDLAFRRAPASELRAAAKATGMRSILEDGKRKIFAGTTTPEDLLRITQAEGIAH